MSERSFLPYAKQSISQQDIEAVSNALHQAVITRGPLVTQFEEAVAAYCDAKYAVAFNSASTALAAAYFAAEAGPGDTVLTTPNSFVASIGPAVALGATPIFIDIDRTTGNLDLNQLLLNINRENSRGKSIVTPVHFAGIPVDMRKLDAAISDYHTVVIEDAAHALGSRYIDGTKVGSCQWSHMTVLSFHPAKTITTGEGGMVTTNDEALLERLRQYRNNGIELDPKKLQGEERPGYYEVNALTGNYNFTDFQAALGLSQLKRIDQFVEKRQQLVAHYREKMAEMQHVRLFTPEEGLHVAYHLFVAQIDFAAYRTTKKKVMETLKQEGIGTQVHYIPLYRHPVFVKRYGDLKEYFPVMEGYYEQALTLPLYYDLKIEEVDRVVTTLKKCLSK